MATINDVCKLAGVSKATVSRVLNETGQVKAQTREAVLAAMQQLGYQPNSLAQALATNTTNSIGLVLPHFESSYFGSILFEAEQGVQKAGKKLLVVNSKNSEQGEKEAVATLAAQRCDAILLYSRHLSEVQLLELQQQYPSPLVILNRRLHHPQLHSFGLDQTQIAQLAMQHLLNLEHRQIACITSPLVSETGKIRYQVYQQALHEQGIELNSSLVIEGDNTLLGGYQAMQQLLQQGISMSAVFACNDDMALGAMRAMHEHGINVPKQVSLIGIDNEPAAAFAIPSLSSVSLPIGELTQQAISLAVEIANKKPQDAQHRLYQGSLIARESTIALKL
ncbi:LacI family DNA-binding transcriptional regulator [Vibrio cholerae]|uniref:LacI family DNA-binding transcriptional regulator n=1 Tax=Vibrio paracholerae TaxID=650003 RepID=UPI0015EF5BDF|nr:LacI family DNA-binding transcriptional regulator [Vibrio paracholerae]ELJ8548567.1 LacI family DNA-binding transcriptional regulator [Vibrio cholerae]ELJ8549865.1 LacI family DNA-binding transcriptional regulator [Vibrio cholerae]ELY5188448.1 LacI family DNA-binding transcriptional regulator [Vibrio cholerae]ELY5189761.1 LacI family DNA-binding transcriptional regulator [Vibrio cholerae]ELY5287410.1 LacI family DNA-binding transcriptional regulator [Vibrio cholerae]